MSRRLVSLLGGTTAIVSLSSLLSVEVEAHGYLASPRSRNFYANVMMEWSSPTEDDPEPEPDPQSLNQGTLCGKTGEHDYNVPRNALGGPMRTNIQATWMRGQEVVLDVVLTANHKGHFVFSGCQVKKEELPTQDCFDKHRLTFVEDLLHGANRDPRHPERAYVAPYVLHPTSGDVPATYSYKMRLPFDLEGDNVLIQWHYLTANSCVHEGYLEYDWPVGWIEAYGWLNGVKGLAACGKAGEGAEQFRNCAEVRISPRGSTPAADDEGRTEVDMETPALGNDRGDEPQLNPPFAKQSKTAKRGKRGKKEKKSMIINKNRVEEDEHKMHDRVNIIIMGKYDS